MLLAISNNGKRSHLTTSAGSGGDGDQWRDLPLQQLDVYKRQALGRAHCQARLKLSSAPATSSTCLFYTSQAFDIMRFLLQAGGRNLSKEMILNRAWGYDSEAVANHVEVYIGFLRKKLASIGSDIRIMAIRRIGYHLEVANND